MAVWLPAGLLGALDAYLVQHYACTLSLEEADAWAWYSVTLADRGLLVSQFMTSVVVQERNKLVHDICMRQKLKYLGLTADVVIRENGTMAEQEAIGLHQLRPLAMAVDPE